VGRHLDLTAEQRTQVQAIVRTARDKSAPVVDELQLAQKTLRREIFAESPDTKKIADLSAKVESLRKQVGDTRLKTSMDIAALLTPEQKKSWGAKGARGARVPGFQGAKGARGARGANGLRGPGSRG
jgi:Spy/CpxP family protein refolding chaperone